MHFSISAGKPSCKLFVYFSKLSKIEAISFCFSSGGKNNPPNNSAYYYLLAQQNANNNQQEENNNQEEQNNNEQQEENNPVVEEVTEVTLDDEVIQKLGYQKEEKEDYYIIKKIDTTKSRILEENEVTSVEIPSTFTYENKTYKITKIGNKAFYKCRNITSVNIPDTVTEIEDGIYDEESGKPSCGAFAFSGITSIQLPKSITKIGDFAFFDCQQLTIANIPVKVTTIGEAAFDLCDNENLSITIPDSVKTIGINAFYFVANIYYKDREELKDKEEIPEGAYGYPYWGAFYYNDQNGLPIK